MNKAVTRQEYNMYDLIIIGSGPAGLSAAIYGKRAGLNLLVIEKNPMSGGQVLNTYEVDNYLGMPKINGFDMGMKFREHADSLEVEFLTATVTGISKKQEENIVHTDEGDFSAAALILANGAQVAKLDVPGEEELSGAGVSYCATCDGAFFRGKHVAVVGGGDVALEDAIYLARSCEKVTLIHRRDELRGAMILQENLKELPNVEILYSHQVKSINGQDAVESITLENSKTNEETELSVSGIFIAVGIRPDTDIYKDLLSLDQGGYIVSPEDCSTNQTGIFAAGDIRKKPIRQIVTAVADGANAAVSAGNYLNKITKK
ncbi:thioredoxin-disulfide reductase [Lachnospiraceae bacterium OttesenSCG-928-D06]|nr:thioredoxin-disulfide reductase [Lachnospiraceae bacterium OttesenSCG-928-D06]